MKDDGSLDSAEYFAKIFSKSNNTINKAMFEHMAAHLALCTTKILLMMIEKKDGEEAANATREAIIGSWKKVALEKIDSEIDEHKKALNSPLGKMMEGLIDIEEYELEAKSAVEEVETVMRMGLRD